jgi:hypothetical protein
MQVKQILPVKPFEPLKIEIVIETPGELQYMRDKVGSWSGAGTYPLYTLLETLVSKSK